MSKDEVFVDGDVPPAFTEDEWRAILDDIIFAFKHTLDQDEEAFYEFSQEKYDQGLKRQKRGLKLFSIYFMNLWD